MGKKFTLHNDPENPVVVIHDRSVLKQENIPVQIREQSNEAWKIEHAFIETGKFEIELFHLSFNSKCNGFPKDLSGSFIA